MQSYQPEVAELWTKDEVQQVWDTAKTQDELYDYHCQAWREFATEQHELIVEGDYHGELEDYIYEHAEQLFEEWENEFSEGDNTPWDSAVYSAAVFLGEIPKGAISNRIISHGTKSWDNNGVEYQPKVDMVGGICPRQ